MNRTVAPVTSSAGGCRPASQSTTSVAPISCQPPGDARVDPAEGAGQADRAGQYPGAGLGVTRDLKARVAARRGR